MSQAISQGFGRRIIGIDCVERFLDGDGVAFLGKAEAGLGEVEEVQVGEEVYALAVRVLCLVSPKIMLNDRRLLQRFRSGRF